ncbi:MAG: methylaspartate mutase subunit E [Peptococcaceae bacterium]|jgi:methylaspartate mutase epsilon subunit|nr:methylaspartate mutase subunit E [Peptococcaceae bacterium]
MGDVRQKRIDEQVFLESRKSVLSLWPTGKEVDLDEAVAYQKKLPDSKIFYKVMGKAKEERRTIHFPRSGTPIVEQEIELVQTLNKLGIFLIPFTTDSYTRNLQLEKAQQGLEESIRTGKPKLNGYPIINHGVKTTRKVVEACDGAFDPRCSRMANSLVAEVAFASGMTAMPCSFFGWVGGYDKKATVEECIETAQYMDRLIGYYADRGVIISTDCHGWLPNGVYPMSINIATQIIEGLVAAEQGVKSLVPLINLQGCMAQDLGDLRVAEKLYRKYLDKLGYTDVFIPGVMASQVPLYAFPQDIGSAFGYITYTAMVGALSQVPACFIKTIDEAVGVPSLESHIQSYKAGSWIFDVVRQQDFVIDNADIQQEMKITEAEVTAILDKVLDLGDGDIVVGSSKAVASGVLDSPFSINVHTKDNVLGIRDLKGACRYLEFGNLPIPEDLKDFHRQKVAERETAEGRKMDYYVSIDDFWAISKGKLLGVKS